MVGLGVSLFFIIGMTIALASCSGSSNMAGGSEKVQTEGVKTKDRSQDSTKQKQNENDLEKGTEDDVDVDSEIDTPTKKEDKIVVPEIANIPDTPQPPKEGCQAFFSGGVVADYFNYAGVSVIFQVDMISEWVGAGKYPVNKNAFPRAVAGTFDGVAFDRGTRITVYEYPEFKGKILFQATGPAVLNNSIWSGGKFAPDGTLYPDFTGMIMRPWDNGLEEKFPPQVRQWSVSNMHHWDHGSMTVECL